MPRRPKYDFEIKIEVNPIDTERNPLEIQENCIKLEDIKKEESTIVKDESDNDSTFSHSDPQAALSPVSNHSEPKASNSPAHQSDSTDSSSKKPPRKIITLSRVKCQVCGKELTKKNMNKHMKNLHPEAAGLEFSCNFCEEKFSKRGSLRIHMSVIHPNEVTALAPEQFTCDYDGKVFKTRMEIHGHMQLHKTSNLVKVRCEICHIEVQQRYLSRHVQEVHTDNIFQCDICSLCIKTSRALKIHKKGHKREHECGICKKAFAVPAKLKIHIKTVHERPVESCVCDVCGKEFRWKGHLESHRQSHVEKEKNFKCDKCPWAFYISSSLKKHQKTHEKDGQKVASMKNPEKCEICSKHLSNKKSLISHMKNVHQQNQEQHPCALCGKVFKSKTTMDAHIKREKCKKE
ncbi:hypothetical protein ACKWTF_014957 [Chironomus riparius]